MAAIDFPNAPANGQKFSSGTLTWTYVTGVGWTLDAATGGGGSGFTFVQETAPTPVKVGDTWFDTSTAASGGTSWVAIEEGAVGSEKVWVQFAPGLGATVPFDPIYVEATNTPTVGNGALVQLAAITPTSMPAGKYRIDGGVDNGYTCNTANTEIYTQIWVGGVNVRENRIFNPTVNLKSMPSAHITHYLVHTGGLPIIELVTFMPAGVTGQAFGRKWLLLTRIG